MNAASRARKKRLLPSYVIFLFLFVFVIGALQFSIQAVEVRAQRFHLLLARGVQTMATITVKRATTSGDMVYFRYTVSDRTYTGRSPVSPETFDTLVVGHVTPVLYLPQSPAQCELALSDVLRWSSGLAHYWRILQIINGVACLLTLLRIAQLRKQLKAA
ncbi:hypothetical protein CWRG_02635 [Chthonomonas calidirosea]|uniref:hypothetical protein n=1 Tax=Chthonomonas calidirosea TaxID=454171 RepID=UPI0006DD3EED|nr:hypothetical protein [Chthonomonas calidirosea]CEK19839.1 hypothetical protein CWRG_02635 [Chthonomonas calidirosea]